MPAAAEGRSHVPRWCWCWFSILSMKAFMCMQTSPQPRHWCCERPSPIKVPLHTRPIQYLSLTTGAHSCLAGSVSQAVPSVDHVRLKARLSSTVCISGLLVRLPPLPQPPPPAASTAKQRDGVKEELRAASCIVTLTSRCTKKHGCGKRGKRKSTPAVLVDSTYACYLLYLYCKKVSI